MKMTLKRTSFLAMLSLERKHIHLEQCRVMVCSAVLAQNTAEESVFQGTADFMQSR